MATCPASAVFAIRVVVDHEQVGHGATLPALHVASEVGRGTAVTVCFPPEVSEPIEPIEAGWPPPPQLLEGLGLPKR
jgi:hypothetical protein